MKLQFVGCGDAFDRLLVKNRSLKTLETHLAKIKPKRLILTHTSDDMLARRDSLPYTSAHDGLTVEL